MDLPSSDLAALLFKLMPGLLAATVFHALTPYPKRDLFDRLVNALIFTMVAQLVVVCLGWILVVVGSLVGPIGPWNETAEFVWGALAGLVIGVAWSHVVNNGYAHRLLQRWGTTKKISSATEWHWAFNERTSWIVLVLKDRRRLMGWPRLFPDQPGVGHFLLEEPAWYLADGREARLYGVNRMLIDAAEVAAVEFMRFADDETFVRHSQEIDQVHRILVECQEGKEDEQQGHEAKPVNEPKRQPGRECATSGD
jgi:hypothetical protein